MLSPGFFDDSHQGGAVFFPTPRSRVGFSPPHHTHLPFPPLCRRPDYDPCLLSGLFSPTPCPRVPITSRRHSKVCPPCRPPPRFPLTPVPLRAAPILEFFLARLELGSFFFLTLPNLTCFLSFLFQISNIAQFVVFSPAAKDESSHLPALPTRFYKMICDFSG